MHIFSCTADFVGMDEEFGGKQAQIKAALLLARIVFANMADVEFVAGSDDLVINSGAKSFLYEGVLIGMPELLGGALMLLRGLVLDLAELEDLDPEEVARVVELSAAMCDAIGTAEVEG